MVRQVDNLDRLRVAAPCPADWGKMAGDDRVRFCAECSLHVYNLSAMTRAEAVALVARTEGRFCARLYRRADGTVITRDCPVGLRAVRRRVARVAGAAFAAVISFCTGAAGQTTSKGDRQKAEGAAQVVIRHDLAAPAQARADEVVFTGHIVDAGGAAVPGAMVVLVNEKTGGRRIVASDDEGRFKVSVPAAGAYTLKVEATAGFGPVEEEHIESRAGEVTFVEVTVVPKGDGPVLMGLVAPLSPAGNGTRLDFTPPGVRATKGRTAGQEPQ